MSSDPEKGPLNGKVHLSDENESYNQYMGSADYYAIEGQKGMIAKVETALVDLWIETMESGEKVTLPKLIGALGELKRDIPNKLKTPNYKYHPVDFGEKEVSNP